jgi:type II secretory pathway component PulK
MRRRDRGIIFVTALGIIVILTGIALVFAQAMRTEALASANRRSQAEADSIELGAEQWVLAQTEAYQSDGGTITQVPAEAIQVGTGYFWIMQFNPDSDSTYQFGITDESSKININMTTTNLATYLMTLPCNMQQDTADAIMDWRSNGSNPTPDGAESSYYSSLQEPYNAKNAQFESVEELLLVSSSAGDAVTPQLLWGVDLNRNGILEDSERQLPGYTGVFNGGGGDTIDGRGIFNYLTCYTHTGTTGSTPGKININTASDVVLTALGMSESGAQTLMSAREGQEFTSVQSASQQVSGTDATVIRNLCTTTSNQYSADIVSVSGDGRAFRRVRIVVDAASIPAKIIYRKDLTSFGWPFPQAIRKQLMSGQTVQVGAVQEAMSSSAGSSSGMGGSSGLAH